MRLRAVLSWAIRNYHCSLPNSPEERSLKSPSVGVLNVENVGCIVGLVYVEMTRNLVAQCSKWRKLPELQNAYYTYRLQEEQWNHVCTSCAVQRIRVRN